MEMSEEQRSHLDEVAKDSLGALSSIAESARAAIGRHSTIGADNLAPADAETTLRARNQLAEISSQLYKGYLALIREPAIARVVAVDGDGHEETYFICRAAPIGSGDNLASYRAPIGRLAALPVGEEAELPNGKVLQVLEKTQLFPKEDGEGWDSIDSIAEWEAFGPFTIESLRKLLEAGVGLDQLAQLLADEQQAANISAGIRRSVIEKMSLRDQPVLDQYQDEIFRLPLNQTLLILGPPGTGKTTTLIRRLGQKLDLEFLDEDERDVVRAIEAGGNVAHDKNWLMFTPTELLKQYLKEAFATEGVPAPDSCVKTWDEYQRMLGRNTFGLLRSANNRGAFVRRELPRLLTQRAEEQPLDWVEEFERWQANHYLDELRGSAKTLASSADAMVSGLGRTVTDILRGAEGNATSVISALVAHADAAKAVREDARQSIARDLEQSLKRQLGADKSFLDSLARFVEEVDRAAAPQDDGEDEETEDEDGEQAHTPRAAAKLAYERALREQARALAAGRAIRRGRRGARVLEWLGERRPSDEELMKLSVRLDTQRNAGRFVDPIRRYFDRLPRRYRLFRRSDQEGRGAWYNREVSVTGEEVTAMELDVLLLSSLRAANELLARPGVEARLDTPPWNKLGPYRELYRNQVLVDEAPDFSPVQLACMAAMCHPRVRSFFACGDFNQRLTTWGTRSIEQVKRVMPGAEIRQISIAYRQSRQLNELARDLIVIFGGDPGPMSLPARVNNEGVAPVLHELASDSTQMVKWLGQQIRAIERFVGRLPSVAVFVPEEADVERIATALSDELSDINTQAVACTDGRVIGQDNDVRVFDIQHVKGLEFEAVFFVGIDRIARNNPRLFDRYLYVGTTRAATYLGIICDERMPPQLEPLRGRFVATWGGM